MAASAVSQLNQILERVALIQSGITCTLPDGTTGAVTNAYPYIEWEVASANVPFFADEVKDWTANIYAGGGSLSQRIATVIPMHLCLMTVEEGASLALNLQTVCAWRDAVFAAFAASVQLSGGHGPLLNDAGFGFVTEVVLKGGRIEALSLGSNIYASMCFDLTVVENFLLPVGM